MNDKINCSLLPFNLLKPKENDRRDLENECLPCDLSIPSARALHYVLRVTDRSSSIDFFTNILGMKVIRHEEFSEGCGPACKGSCGTLWSKTMVGYGPEDHYFCLELVYDYSVMSTIKGNAVSGIYIKSRESLLRAAHRNYPIRNGNYLMSPAGYKIYISEEPQPKRKDPIEKICLLTRNMRMCIKFWHDLLGFEMIELNHRKKFVGFSYKSCAIIIQFQETADILIHNYGRMVFTCPGYNLPKIERLITRARGTIVHPLTTVKPPGQHSYRILVIADTDDHELCFYDEQSYRKIAKYSPDAGKIVRRYIALEKGVDLKEGIKTCCSPTRNSSVKGSTRSSHKEGSTQSDPTDSKSISTYASVNTINTVATIEDQSQKNQSPKDQSPKEQSLNDKNPKDLETKPYNASFTSKSTQSERSNTEYHFGPIVYEREAEAEDLPRKSVSTYADDGSSRNLASSPRRGSDAASRDVSRRNNDDATSRDVSRRNNDDATSREVSRRSNDDSTNRDATSTSNRDATTKDNTSKDLSRSRSASRTTFSPKTRSTQASTQSVNAVTQWEQPDVKDTAENASVNASMSANPSEPSEPKMVVTKRAAFHSAAQ